jgi:hypothetical protein
MDTNNIYTHNLLEISTVHTRLNATVSDLSILLG